jgi:hypothetical protein
MSAMPRSDGFASVLQSVGKRPRATNQNVTRHYSETLSKSLALWLRDLLLKDKRVSNVLSPEARVPTCYGQKSLDIGCLDDSGYLSLDISIKTFSFRDRATGRYTHNFTGRFYELLGEGLDLRLSYPEAVLTALVFLPMDSCDDGTSGAASSFGNAVKQYAKIAGRGTDGEHALSFEHVFIGLYDESDGVSFFDARTSPPRHGPPPKKALISTGQMLETVLATVADRAALRATHKMNIQPAFRWADAAS